METAEDVDMNRILKDAGVEDSSSIDIEERRKIYKALQESQNEHNAASSSVNMHQESPASGSEAEIKLIEHKHKGNTYGERSTNTTPEDDSPDKIETIPADNFYVTKTYNSISSNHANTKDRNIREKDVSKTPVSKTVNYASAAAGSAGKGGSQRSPKVENKPAPGAAVAVKDLKHSNNTYSCPQPTANVWLSKPNGTSSKKSLSLQQKEEGEAESNEEKDNVNNIADNSQDRESPDIIEEIVRRPLMSYACAFENRKGTSKFPDFSFPSLNLPEKEWVSQMAQHFFAMKVARVEAEAANKKWACLSERTISVASLENALPRTSPSHNKDEGASSLGDMETSPKTRLSPQDGGDAAAPVDADSSPKQDTNIPDSSDADAAMALADASANSAKSGSAPAQTSPAGTSVDEKNFSEEGGRRKSQRNRTKVRRGGRGGGPQRSPLTFNDDNSNGGPSSPAAKNNDKEYFHDDANYPAIDGSPSNDTKNEDKVVQCPMCDQFFAEHMIESHAWSCPGKADEKQVAGGDESEAEHDVTNTKRKHKTVYDFDSDEDTVPKRPKPCTSVKRKPHYSVLQSSDDEEVPVSSGRQRASNIFVECLISEDEDEDEPPNRPRK